MARLLQIFFKDYNNFLIPTEEKNGKKYLVLNKVHATFTKDLKYYDECLKITYDLDKDIWSVRLENMERTKLNDSKLKNFLYNNLKKYEVPNIDYKNFDWMKNINISVLEYNLPLEKIKSDDLNSLKQSGEEFVNKSLSLGGEETLRFIQTKLMENLFLQTNGLWKNCSDEIAFKIASSGDSIEKISKLIKNESVNETTVVGKFKEWFVKIKFTKI